MLHFKLLTFVYIALFPSVSTQRLQYKILTSGSSESTPMTPERANKLNSIGFVWATKDPRHVPWETRYEELCQFVVGLLRT